MGYTKQMFRYWLEQADSAGETAAWVYNSPVRTAVKIIAICSFIFLFK